jgi:hypothetical protein
MPASFQECVPSSIFRKMLTVTYLHRILNSRLFKFIVGKEVDGSPTEFLVHEEAIALAHLSKPLYTMMKGEMGESQAGCTIWADVSKETFERFTQFAYTGDYSIPKLEKRNKVVLQKEAVTDDSLSDSFHGLMKRLDEAKAETVDEPEPADDLNIDLKRSKKKAKSAADLRPSWMVKSPAPMTDADLERGTIPITKRDKYPARHLRVHSDDFKSLNFPLLAPRNNHDKMCEPAEHFDPDQSYTEAFLSHASLYILGDLQLIDSLKALALFKLHKTLCVFRVDDGNAEDIIALARYAYSDEGGGGGLDEGIGGLRSLVSQYMATNALALSSGARWNTSIYGRSLKGSLSRQTRFVVQRR